jgi:transcriptional regulator of met regulon
MSELNWERVCELAGRKEPLHTKTKIPFHILRVSNTTVTVRVRSGEEHPIYRTNLETAVMKIQTGVELKGPKDYKDQIADDRPSYAWAILKELGYLS